MFFQYSEKNPIFKKSLSGLRASFAVFALEKVFADLDSLAYL